jgi:hypothetical protein
MNLTKQCVYKDVPKQLYFTWIQQGTLLLEAVPYNEKIAHAAATIVLNV